MIDSTKEKIISKFEELRCDTTPFEDNMALLTAAAFGNVSDVYKVAQGLLSGENFDPTALDFAILTSPCGPVQDYLIGVSHTGTPEPTKFYSESSLLLRAPTPISSTRIDKNRELIIAALSGNMEQLILVAEDLKETKALDREAISIAKMQPLKLEVEAYLNSLLLS